MLVLFHSFTHSDKNMIEKLLHSGHQLMGFSSKLVHIQVFQRNEDHISQEFGCKKEKSNQVILGNDRIQCKLIGSSQN